MAKKITETADYLRASVKITDDMTVGEAKKIEAARKRLEKKWGESAIEFLKSSGVSASSFDSRNWLSVSTSSTWDSKGDVTVTITHYDEHLPNTYRDYFVSKKMILSGDTSKGEDGYSTKFHM